MDTMRTVTKCGKRSQWGTVTTLPLLAFLIHIFMLIGDTIIGRNILHFVLIFYNFYDNIRKIMA